MTSSFQIEQLPGSRKPQIIRLHNLEQYERHRFSSQFLSALNEIFPHFVQRSKLLNHPVSRNLLSDIYFTYMTICHCRRRLGEQYCYVTMYKHKHYEQEGVLVNKNTRLLVFVMEILGRNAVPFVLEKSLSKIQQKGSSEEVRNSNNSAAKVCYEFVRSVLKCLGNEQEILSNAHWFLMMLFMLNLTNSPNLVDNVLGLKYVYTFFNEKQTNISYKLEGLLLLAVFVVKGVSFAFRLKEELTTNKTRTSSLKSKNMAPSSIQSVKQSTNSKSAKNQQQQICRICYSSISAKSCTKCGHCFCWQCIIQSLEYNPECPACRTKCFPREVIQLKNF